MKPTPHHHPWLTSAVASGTLHTVSMPPSFQCPSSLTKIEDKQTLLCVRCPWERDKQKRNKTDTPKPEGFKQLNTSHHTQCDVVFGTRSITNGAVLKMKKPDAAKKGKALPSAPTWQEGREDTKSYAQTASLPFLGN